MKIKLLLTTIVCIFLNQCQHFDRFHKINYPKSKMENILAAINNTCANQGYVIQYSNAQGAVNTDWKNFPGILVGERIRLNIVFSETEIKIREIYNYQGSTGWQDSNAEPMYSARGAREKFANELRELLGPQATVEAVKQPINN